ncbi:MAG: hypothetical protein Q8P78_03110, partial [bacterium]|nr:hypothetical protein [bacterium]
VATSTAGYMAAILAEAPAGDRFVWMETAGLSLRDSLNAPRNVFTVIDRLQTPRIASVSSLSFTASSTISFTTGATSTPALVIRDSGDIAISGDVTISGNARMGTTTAESLEITTGYLKLNPKEAAPQAEDCAESSQYGRMSFDALSDTLYLCGQNGWRSFVPNEADPTAEEEVVAEEEPVVEEEVVVEEEPTATSTPEEL